MDAPFGRVRIEAFEHSAVSSAVQRAPAADAVEDDLEVAGILALRVAHTAAVLVPDERVLDAYSA